MQKFQEGKDKKIWNKFLSFPTCPESKVGISNWKSRF